MPFGQDDEEEHQRVSSIEDTPSTADESGSKAVSVRNSATARISSLAGRPSAGEGREGSQTAGVSVNHRNSNEAAATTSAGRTEAAEKEKRFSWFCCGHMCRYTYILTSLLMIGTFIYLATTRFVFTDDQGASELQIFDDTRNLNLVQYFRRDAFLSYDMQLLDWALFVYPMKETTQPLCPGARDQGFIQCSNNGTCNMSTHTCVCHPDFVGLACNERAIEGRLHTTSNSSTRISRTKYLNWKTKLEFLNNITNINISSHEEEVEFSFENRGDSEVEWESHGDWYGSSSDLWIKVDGNVSTSGAPLPKGKIKGRFWKHNQWNYHKHTIKFTFMWSTSLGNWPGEDSSGFGRQLVDKSETLKIVPIHPRPKKNETTAELFGIDIRLERLFNMTPMNDGSEFTTSEKELKITCLKPKEHLIQFSVKCYKKDGTVENGDFECDSTSRIMKEGEHTASGNNHPKQPFQYSYRYSRSSSFELKGLPNRQPVEIWCRRVETTGTSKKYGRVMKSKIVAPGWEVWGSLTKLSSLDDAEKDGWRTQIGESLAPFGLSEANVYVQGAVPDGQNACLGLIGSGDTQRVKVTLHDQKDPLREIVLQKFLDFAERDRVNRLSLYQKEAFFKDNADETTFEAFCKNWKIPCEPNNERCPNLASDPDAYKASKTEITIVQSYDFYCKCPNNFAGTQCKAFCPNLCNNRTHIVEQEIQEQDFAKGLDRGVCDHDLGKCVCSKILNTSGPDCAQQNCPCESHSQCYKKLVIGNETQWECKCPPMQYGLRCNATHWCPNNCSNNETFARAGFCHRDTGHCTCYKGYDGFDCSEEISYTIPLQEAVSLDLVWGLGIEKDYITAGPKPTGLDFWSDATQKQIYKVLERAHEDTGLRFRTDITTFPEAWNKSFPGSLGDLRTFFYPAGIMDVERVKAYGRDVGTIDRQWQKSSSGTPKNTTVTYVRARISIDVAKKLKAKELKVHYDAWVAFVYRENNAVNEGAPQMLMVSESWSRMQAALDVEDSIVKAYLTTALCTAMIVLLFTGNFIITFIMMISSFMTACCLFGLLSSDISMYGDYDANQATAIILFASLNFDFAIHIAYNYIDTSAKVQDEAKTAAEKILRAKYRGKAATERKVTAFSVQLVLLHVVREVGVSVVVGAVATIIGSLLLLFCKINLLKRFGAIFFTHMILSLLYTFFFLVPMLLVVGSFYKRGDLCFNWKQVIIQIIEFLKHQIRGGAPDGSTASGGAVNTAAKALRQAKSTVSGPNRGKS
jgi:hypothetical protein